jgi:hypothetical protein
MAVACVVASIKGLGLEVSLEKTEAEWFCRKSSHGEPSKGLKMRLGEADIEVGTQMKYLGLILDSHWTFEAQLERLAPANGDDGRTEALAGQRLGAAKPPGWGNQTALHGGTLDGPRCGMTAHRAIRT